MTDPLHREVHGRSLDYRERHQYFGKLTKLLTMAEFVPLDAEHAVLDAKGDSRDDEEAARFEEVCAVLFRD